MRKTCYVVDDAVGSAVFLRKMEAENFIRSIILDKMSELDFAARVFDEFMKTSHKVAGFRAAIRELAVLAGNKDSTIEGLLSAWNTIFISDFLKLVEAELYEDPLTATEV
jgi:hypothetical protein